MSNQPHKWLVIFLIHADLNMDAINERKVGYIPVQTQKDTLFHILHDYKSNDNTKIIVIENRLEKKNQDGIIIRKTFIMEKVANKKGLEAYDTEELDLNVDNGESLREVLKGIIITEKAQKRMIITKGHGSIFGIFLTEESVASRGITTNKLIPPGSNGNGQSSTGLYNVKNVNDPGFYTDLNDNVFVKPETVQEYISSFDVLTNKELALAMQAGLAKGKKIDVLVMDNCLMQNVCTQFEMKDIVHHLAAAQSGIGYPGFNYQVILDHFLTKSSGNTNIIINKIVSTLMNNKKFNKSPILLDELKRTWSIHIKDLSEFSVFEEKFTQLINAIINHPASRVAINYLKDTLDGSFNYNKYCLPNNAIVDIKVVLYFLAKALKKVEKCSDLVAPIEECLQAIELIKGISMVGPGLFESQYSFFDEILPEPISGIGILWPVDSSSIDETRLNFLHDPQLKPEFLEKSGFLKLLQQMDVI